MGIFQISHQKLKGPLAKTHYLEKYSSSNTWLDVASIPTPNSPMLLVDAECDKCRFVTSPSEPAKQVLGHDARCPFRRTGEKGQLEGLAGVPKLELLWSHAMIP
jgi:hypothetical protein